MGICAGTVRVIVQGDQDHCLVQTDQSHCLGRSGSLLGAGRSESLLSAVLGICAGRAEPLLSAVWVFVQDVQGHCLALYLCKMIRVTAWCRLISHCLALYEYLCRLYYC